MEISFRTIIQSFYRKSDTCMSGVHAVFFSSECLGEHYEGLYWKHIRVKAGKVEHRVEIIISLFWVKVSGSFLAETQVISPRKSFISIIYFFFS